MESLKRLTFRNGGSRSLNELAPSTPTNSTSTQVGIPIARHNLLGKKFNTGCRKRFGNLHAFPTSGILRTKYDREITTEKEAKSKQSNEHFCICFELNHFTSLTSVVFLLLQKPHRNVKTCICTYISNSSTPSV